MNSGPGYGGGRWHHHAHPGNTPQHDTTQQTATYLFIDDLIPSSSPPPPPPPLHPSLAHPNQPSVGMALLFWFCAIPLMFLLGRKLKRKMIKRQQVINVLSAIEKNPALKAQVTLTLTLT